LLAHKAIDWVLVIFWVKNLVIETQKGMF